MTLTQPKTKGKNNIIVYLALAIAIISLALSVFIILSRPTISPGTASRKQTTLERIKKDGVMRVGYGGFPPYTIVNVNETDPNKRVTGFAIDMVNEIAQRSTPPLKVEWYNLDWDTMKADMLSGKFDFLADAVYQTVPRALDYGLSDPYSYFGIAVALVRKNEVRFRTFADLDRNDITISLAEGYTSTEYAKKHLSKPNFKSVVVGKDAFIQLDDVLLGRADVALQDVPTVVQYVRAHPDQVKALWLDNPPSTVAAGFVTRQEDADLLAFLNACIRLMKVDGTLQSLDKKWKSLGHFEQFKFIPGEGLVESGKRTQ